MTKPLFAVLKANHMGRQMLAAQVYEAIGHKPELALRPTWENTCAIRMSVALIAAGIKIRPGRLQIKAGRFKDEWVEPGQRNLSDFLANEIGKPEVYKGAAQARNTIAWRRGIISFFKIHGTRQGHIDLVSVQDWPELMCSGSCYWDAVEVWFWPLM
jgi:hypothetical protein